MVPKMFPRGQREPEGRKPKETWGKKSARAEKRGVGREGHKECQFSSEIVGRLESKASIYARRFYRVLSFSIAGKGQTATTAPAGRTFYPCSFPR